MTLVGYIQSICWSWSIFMEKRSPDSFPSQNFKSVDKIILYFLAFLWRIKH